MRVFCLANDKEEVGKLHEQERDTHKLWHGNCFKVYFGAENQTLPDKDMPFRIMSYDGVAYRSQLLKTEEKRVKGKLRQVPSKKRHPVISIVLYFGEKPWKYPKNLVDCFEPPLPENKVTDILRKYIQDYKVHVFDIPRLTPEEVNRFKSDFRIVAEHFVHAYTDEDYVPEDAVITHVDEFLKLMKVLTGDQRYEEAARSLTEEEKEVGVMSCRVLDYREAKGRKEGEDRKEYYTLYNI